VKIKRFSRVTGYPERRLAAMTLRDPQRIEVVLCLTGVADRKQSSRYKTKSFKIFVFQFEKMSSVSPVSRLVCDVSRFSLVTGCIDC